MSNIDRRNEWTVLVGIGLVALGIYLFLGSFAWWLVAPVAAVIRVASRVVWPLILIGIGVLLVVRARGGGWSPSGRPLYRSRDDRMVAGVLAGVAKWLGVNPMPVRVLFVFLTFFSGFGGGVLLYILAAVLLPEEPFGSPTGYTAAAPPAPAPPAPPVPPATPTGWPARTDAPAPPAPPAAPASAPEPPTPHAAPPVPPAPPAS